MALIPLCLLTIPLCAATQINLYAFINILPSLVNTTHLDDLKKIILQMQEDGIIELTDDLSAIASEKIREVADNLSDTSDDDNLSIEDAQKHIQSLITLHENYRNSIVETEYSAKQPLAFQGLSFWNDPQESSQLEQHSSNGPNARGEPSNNKTLVVMKEEQDEHSALLESNQSGYNTACGRV